MINVTIMHDYDKLERQRNVKVLHYMLGKKVTIVLLIALDGGCYEFEENYQKEKWKC